MLPRSLRSVPAALLPAAVLLAVPAAAQDADLSLRVKRLEQQVRALQRAVFPGGAGELLAPEIAPAQPNAAPAGSPASSALADAQARLTALEGQVAGLTDQTERATYTLGQLEGRFAALEARLAALEARAPAAVAGEGAVAPVVDEGVGAEGEAAPADPPAPEPEAAPAAAGVGARASRVAAVARPSTADPADDRYVYGYRLWAANLYPEARTELAAVVKTYPKHRRASWAQNLIGRSYMDEGLVTKDKALLTKAAEAFFDNYQTFQDGERAPDSLYYLGRTLMALKEKARACDAYGAFDEVYGPVATSALKAQVRQGQKDAGC